jgi:hypothetical protein
MKVTLDVDQMEDVALNVERSDKDDATKNESEVEMKSELSSFVEFSGLICTFHSFPCQVNQTLLKAMNVARALIGGVERREEPKPVCEAVQSRMIQHTFLERIL